MSPLANETKRNLLFVINPVAGNRPKKNIPALVKKYLDTGSLNYELGFTTHKGHAKSLALDAVKANFHGVIAVGGDGTINEVGQSLIGTSTAMGILPCGSGNGLARFMHIPMNLRRAIEVINQQHLVKIDAAKANERAFFVTAGIGFDAHVGKLFAKSPHRGFGSYVQAVLSSIFTYLPQNYQINVNGELMQTKAFAITLANSGQYGNNAYIAPQALINDGLLDLCIIKPFPRYLFADLSLRLFNRTIDQSRFVVIQKITSLEIFSEGVENYHLDGENFEMEQNLKLEILPESLNLMIPTPSMKNAV